MPYFVSKDDSIGFVIEGEIIKGKGIFDTSVEVTAPDEIKKLWPSFNLERLIELKGYTGPAKAEVHINELLILIHSYAEQPPSDHFLQTLVYINGCNILEYLEFSNRELPNPPQNHSLYDNQKNALLAMGKMDQDTKIELIY